MLKEMDIQKKRFATERLKYFKSKYKHLCTETLEKKCTIGIPLHLMNYLNVNLVNKNTNIVTIFICML
jgi:hypothetical protein